MSRKTVEWSEEDTAAIIAYCGGEDGITHARLSAIFWQPIAKQLGRKAVSCYQHAAKICRLLRNHKPKRRAPRQREAPPVEVRPAFITPISRGRLMGRR